MARKFDNGAFHDAVVEFVRMVGSQHANLRFSDFDKAQADGVIPAMWVEQVFREYGVEVEQLRNQFSENRGDSRNQLFNEYDLDEDELEAAVEMYKSVKQNSGRPSKVEKWSQKIESGSATLEEAKSHMSDPTWYKLKKRVEQ